MAAALLHAPAARVEGRLGECARAPSGTWSPHLKSATIRGNWLGSWPPLPPPPPRQQQASSHNRERTARGPCPEVDAANPACARPTPPPAQLSPNPALVLPAKPLFPH